MTLPLAVDIRGLSVLVVGTGRGASQRIARLLAEGASVTLVAPDASTLGIDGAVKVDRAFEDEDCDGKSLIVAATGSDLENQRVWRAARSRGVLVNAVDDPSASSCFFTAEHHEGDVVIAVSTSGASPALAQWLRDRIASSLPAGVARAADELRARRRHLHEAGRTTEGINWGKAIESLLVSKPPR